ncbi:histone-lysine N-methyltransferase PRDM9 [Ditylenchus destructor]|uniref:Histone-lysine N-methyltransferase PRDM9 n=1 Tax=Ditylenchus destructor TaxID=166010 RepID=A0AAD4R179_9BILA|nr:histone-lysine N-methyltransferase PRDM9 [Ditylenchus destructor]
MEKAQFLRDYDISRYRIANTNTTVSIVFGSGKRPFARTHRHSNIVVLFKSAGIQTLFYLFLKRNSVLLDAFPVILLFLYPHSLSILFGGPKSGFMAALFAPEYQRNPKPSTPSGLPELVNAISIEDPSSIPLPEGEPCPKKPRTPDYLRPDEQCGSSTSSASTSSPVERPTPEPPKDSRQMCFAVNAFKRKVCIIKREKIKQECYKYFLLENISDETYSLFGKSLSDDEVDESLDDYVHCGDCECFYTYSCLKHPLYLSLDRDASSFMDNPARALRTLPGYLFVATSSIPNAGKGVFSKVDIPVGVVYGPYEGILRKDQRRAECDGYSWEIKHGSETVYVDGRDARYANWMRFINSSRFEAEQNLIAFQYGGSVYYRVFRPIDREKELLVWYGESFGKALGVNTMNNMIKTMEGPTVKRRKSKACKNPFVY